MKSWRSGNNTSQAVNRSFPVIELLEPRIMFSADPLAATTDSGGEDSFWLDNSELSVVKDDTAFLYSREVVIIDAGVSDADTLRWRLLEQNGSGPELEVFVLDAQRDGVDQISDLLSRYNNLSAVHLISHGSDGSLTLGNTALDTEKLSEYTEQLQGWAGAFSESGDLLLYGCSLASGAGGQTLVNQLAGLTGADVAASDDLTGAALLNGDWDLEYQHGSIETAVVFSDQIRSLFQTTLADTPGVNDAPTISRFPGDATVAEDSVFSFTGAYAITLGDDDAGSGQLRLTLSTNQGGLLSLSSSAGVTGYTGPASAMTLFGSLNDLSSAIQTLTLTPAQHFVGTETFTIFLNDQGNTGTDPGNSGDASSEEDATELKIIFTADNDPPQRIAGTVNNMVIDNHAGLTSLGLGGLDYGPGGGADESGQTLTYTVTKVVRAPLTGNVYLADGTTVVTPGVYTLDQLRGMQFDPILGSTGNADLIVWTVTDSGGESITESIRLRLQNPNVDPSVTTSVGAVNFDEGDAAVVIDPALVLNDPDGLAGINPWHAFSATITISGNYQAGDLLGFTDTAKIQGNLSGNTLTLSVISGQSASVAEFQAALRSVTFYNGSDHPDENNRRISFSFFDGRDTSNMATKDIMVAGQNDAPSVIGSLPVAITVTEDVSSPIDLSMLQVADPDVGSGELTLTLTSSTGGIINAQAGAGISISRITPGNTQISLSGTVTDLNNYLSDRNNITYRHGVADTQGSQADELVVTLGDNGNSGSGGLGVSITILVGRIDINITPVDDPTVIAGDTSYSGNEGDLARGQVFVSDADGISAYFVTGASQHGIVTFNTVTGEWSYRSQNPDWFGTDLFTFTVFDSLGNSTSQSIVITLANVDDAAQISGDTRFEDVVGDDITGTLSAHDVDGLTDGTYFSISAAPGQGQAMIDPETGDWRFLPPSEEWVGSVSFKVAVSDDLGGVTEQLITVRINPEPVDPGGEITVPGGGEGGSGNGVAGPDEGEEEKPVPEGGSGITEPAPEKSEGRVVITPVIPATPDLRILLDLPEMINPAGRTAPVQEIVQAKFLDLRNLDLSSAERPEVEVLTAQPLLNNEDFTRELDGLREAVVAETEAERRDFELSKDTIIGVTFSVSAVLLSGVLRAGSLLACFVSILPLWKGFDPLPILNARQQPPEADEPEADSPVEALFEPPAERQETRL